LKKTILLLIKKSFLYLFVKSKNIKTTAELARQNRIIGNQQGGKIGDGLTNNKLYGKELINNEGCPNLDNPRLTHINTREEIAKLAGVI